VRMASRYAPYGLPEGANSSGKTKKRSAFATFSSPEEELQAQLVDAGDDPGSPGVVDDLSGHRASRRPAGFDQPKSWALLHGVELRKRTRRSRRARSALVMRKKIGKRISRSRWMWISFCRMFCAFLSCSSGVSSRRDVHGITHEDAVDRAEAAGALRAG